MFLTSWFWPSPEPSRHPPSMVDIPLLTEEDMASIRSANPRPKGRLCRHGHRVWGSNAYRRSNGKVECKTCRANASKRYRTRVRSLHD